MVPHFENNLSDTSKVWIYQSSRKLSDHEASQVEARRMEVYTSFYDKNMAQVRGIQADIIDHQSYLKFLENNVVLFFGNGADKCRETISHPNAIFIDQIHTSASYMAPLSEREYKNQQFSDLAYYEPFYLKDFVATIPVKNIFKSDRDN